MQPQAPHRSAAARSARASLEEIKQLACAQPPPRDVLGRLRAGGVAMVVELDAADPAAGRLAERFEGSGVGAVAVPAGRGLATLEQVARISARTGTPVVSLRPADTARRIWQLRACGADAVALRAAALPDQALLSLVERAESIGMAALVEVRDGRDVVRALRAGSRALLLRPPAGAGRAAARARLHEMLAMVPERVVRVAECGPAGRADLIACARRGADAVLLRRAALAGAGADPGAAVADLACVGAHPALARRGGKGH